MADLSKVKIGSSTYDLKDTAARAAIGDENSGLIKSLADEAAARAAADTQLQTNITAEKTRAEGAESGLDTRIKALESKGRYLSTWDATTGKPETYPEAGQFVDNKYNYRTGDYYIVNKVGSSNLMPDGAYITKSGDTYTVPSKAFSGTLNLGDQFQYDGSKWTHIASATTVAFANIQGDAMDNTNLAGKLNAKVDKTQTIAGVDLQDNITKAELQSALDLKALAYKDSATGTVAGQTITGVKASYTPEGSVTLNDLTQTSTAASLTKADYTPAGSVNVTANESGSVLTGGSINVTVKDAATASDITNLTYESYTPAGTIAATTSGSFSALKSATFGEDSTNGVQIEGSVSAPAITVTAGSEKTFATSLKGGSVASFTEGTFTPASLGTGFVTAGSDAELSAGAQASLTPQATAKFVKKAHSFTVGTGTDAETLIIGEVETTDTNYYTDAVTDRGTFTANTLQTLTGGKATVVDVSKFDGGSKAADTFVANTLQDVNTDKVHDTPTAALAEAPAFTGKKYKVATTDDVALKEVAFSGTAADIKLSGAKYLKQEIDTKTFTPTKASLSFSGTEVKDFQVTGVNYDKATANGATFAGTAGQANVGDIVISDKDVTVE